MTSEIRKLEITKEVKCNPQKFYEVMKYMHHEYPIIFPQTYKSAEVLKGDGVSAGSVKFWKDVLPGNSEVFTCTEKIEEIDDEKMLLVLNVYEGNVRNYYKLFVVKVQVIPGEERNLVKWTVEYEKENEDMPDPHDYMDLYSVENDKLYAYLVSKRLN